MKNLTYNHLILCFGLALLMVLSFHQDSGAYAYSNIKYGMNSEAQYSQKIKSNITNEQIVDLNNSTMGLIVFTFLIIFSVICLILLSRKKEILTLVKNYLCQFIRPIKNKNQNLLDNIAHELRAPTHAIMNFSKMGIDRIDKDNKDKLLGYFQDIRESSEKLDSMINNLLDISKMEAGSVNIELKECDLLELTSESLKDFKAIILSKKLKVKIEKTDLLLKADLDGNKILRVLINLIGNAVKFTPDEGVVVIKFNQAKINQSNDAYMVSVSNEGSFVPQNELESIFDKFTQSSETRNDFGGTGVGLSICREIIKMHGGKIWAESPHKGKSTFCFTVPIKQKN